MQLDDPEGGITLVWFARPRSQANKPFTAILVKWGELLEEAELPTFRSAVCKCSGFESKKLILPINVTRRSWSLNQFCSVFFLAKKHTFFLCPIPVKTWPCSFLSIWNGVLYKALTSHFYRVYLLFQCPGMRLRYEILEQRFMSFLGLHDMVYYHEIRMPK